MGCHILDPPFWALNLGSPIGVEANVSYAPSLDFWTPLLDGSKRWKEAIGEEINVMKQETYPSAAIIRYEFPERDGMPPIKLTWYDGGMLPPRPKEHPDHKGIGGNGVFIIGDKGVITHGSHGARGLRILPEEKDTEYKRNPPEKTIQRVSGHHSDWIEACKGGDPASSNFDYGGPLTEMVLLGIIALRVPDEKLLWDSENMQFTNSQGANELVKPIYRDGWTL